MTLPGKLKQKNSIAAFLTVLLIWINLLTSAQDIHFTQFQFTPLFINPANTGITDGNFRLVNNYRNQWSRIETSYNTLSISADKPVKIKNHFFGIGGLFVHDVSSVYNLSVDKLNFSLGYSKFYKNHQFSLGVQPGVVFKYFNSSAITFNSQFDPVSGTFNPGLPSDEDDLYNNLSYFDLNIGALWRARIKNWGPSAGFSINHINKPVEEFVHIENPPLPLKLNVHAAVTIPLKRKFSLTPTALYTLYSRSQEFIGGGILGYSPEKTGMVKNIYCMSLFRINPVRNFDALMVGAGVHFEKIDVAVSYDLNISSLRKASNFYGAFEISLVYKSLRFNSKNIPVPCYML